MLQRFYQLKECVRQTRFAIESDLNFSKEEMQQLSEIISALEPLRMAVESIFTEDANLLTADVCLKFVINELTMQKSTLRLHLKEAVVKIIKERRTTYSDLLDFLHNPNYLEDKNECDAFEKRTLTDLTKFLIEIAKRLLKSDMMLNEENTDNEMPVEQDSCYTVSSSNTMKTKLHEMITKKISASYQKISYNSKKPQSLKCIINMELKLFREQHIRGKYLEIIYNALLTISPTSIQSERAFSSAENFCTKIRSSLNDSTLDTLCFLRHYFSKHEK